MSYFKDILVKELKLNLDLFEKHQGYNDGKNYEIYDGKKVG
jgi:hypothetical protein